MLMVGCNAAFANSAMLLSPTGDSDPDSTNTTVTVTNELVSFSVKDRIFIPDGSACYQPHLSVPLQIDGFGDSDTISSAQDIRSICLNFEYSSMGDYIIAVNCPNYQQPGFPSDCGRVVLKYKNNPPDSIPDGTTGGGERFTGIPYGGQEDDLWDGMPFCDSLHNPYGLGYNYCFSLHPDYTFVNGQPCDTPMPANAGMANGPMITTSYSFWPVPDGYLQAGDTCGTVSVSTLDSSNHANKTGYYVPADSFDKMIGCSLNGTWSLEIIDLWSVDNGWFFGWDIDFASTHYQQDNTATDTISYGLPWNSMNSMVPIDAAYADYGFENEFIYPASSLSNMEGGAITQITFYATCDSLDFPETFLMRMEEVEDSVTQATSWIHTNDAQLVWTGSVNIRDSLWTITLDSAFTYMGGNLLFSIQCLGETNGFWTGNNIFYCHNTNYRTVTMRRANSQHEFGNSWMATSPQVLPSVSFVYTPNAAVPCHRPLAITTDSLGARDAILSWDTVAGAQGYEWKLTSAGITIDSGYTTGTSVSLTSLDVASNYIFYVRTICDSVSTSPYLQLPFTTECDILTPADMPFVEDFEAYENYVTEIPCWTMLAYSRPLTLRVEHYSTGNNIFNFWPQSNSEPHFAILPEMQNIPAMDMTFKMRNHGVITGNLQVGVMTDPEDTLTFTPMAVFDTVHTLDEWQEVAVNFGTYNGSTGHIALRAGMPADLTRQYIEIDDIVVNITPTCQQMQSIEVANITSSTADIIIHDSDSTGATYIATITSSTQTTVQSNSQTIHITDLVSTTDYTVSVKKRCADGTSHTPISTTFHTLCGTIAELPWNYGFEVDNGTFDEECWNVLERYTANNAKVYTMPRHSGDHSISMNSTSGLGTILVLPEFSTPTDSLRMGLWVNRGTSYINNSYDTASGIELGIVADPDDATTFTTHKVCIPTSLNSWVHYETNFPNAPAGSRLAIRVIASSTIGLMAIDDITVDIDTVTSTDTCVAPEAIMVSSIRGDGAVLYISSAAPSPHYMLYIDGDSVELHSNQHIIAGLEADSLYTVEVCGICSDGSTTARTSVQFRTATCPTEPLPWSEDFDDVTLTDEYGGTPLTDVLPCWNRCGNGSSKIHYSYYANSNRLEMELGSYQYRNIVVLPDLQGDINNMELSFTSLPSYHYNLDDSTHLLQVGYITIPSDTAYFRPVVTFEAQDYMVNNNAISRTESVSFSGVPYGARIAFRMPYGDITRVWYIDDIEVHAVQQCPRPQAVVVQHIGSDTAQLYISDSISGQTYTITLDADDGTEVTLQSSDQTVTLNGLTPGTRYTASVSAVCTDGSLTAAVTCQFRTACTPLTASDMPFVDDLESYPEGRADSANLCWRLYNLYDDGTIQANHTTANISEDDAIFTAAQSGTKYITLGAGYNTPTYWVLQAIDTLDGKALEFGYRTGWGAHVSFNYHLDVGVMSDPLDPTTFILLDSIVAISETYQTMHVEFDGFVGGYITLRNLSDAGVVIDDLNINTIVPPVPPAPTNLQLVSVDSLSATISWQPGGDESSWQLELSDSESVVELSASAIPFTITDLTPLTTYSVRVAAVTERDQKSDWSLPIEFTTLDTIHDSVGISNIYDSRYELDIYPNPASSTVTVEVDHPATLMLMDATGRERAQWKVESGKNSIDLRTLSPGIYFIRLEGSPTTRKLIVTI